MVILRPLLATAVLVAAVGSTQVGMADSSTEMKEQSSRTVIEVPAPPSAAQQDTQVETHTSMSKRQKEEADGSVQMQKKSSTTTEERATTADPLQPDTVHSETHSQQETTKVTP
jgi:ABC-type Na+ efflux pump permease subunit